MASRASKSGDQYQIEKKLEQRYDEADALGTPKAVMDWIAAALQGEDKFTPCTSTNWKDIQDYLKDGVVLCRLVNKLLAHASMEKISYKANAKMAFVQMANVEGFNKACERYGVAQSALFQTVDVSDGRKGPMVNVINCLNHLGFTANSKGFTPKYTPPEAPKPEW